MNEYVPQFYGIALVWNASTGEWREVDLSNPAERAYHDRIQAALRRSFGRELKLTVTDEVSK